MGRWIVSVLAVSCSLAAIASAGEEGKDVTVLVDDFENVGSGTKWVVVGVTGGDLKAEVENVPAGGRDGRGCARLTVGAGASLTIRQEYGKGFVSNGDKECLVLCGNPAKVGVWVKGNGSEAKLTLAVGGTVSEKRKKKVKDKETGKETEQEVTEEVFRAKELDLGALSFDGWKYVEKEVPAFEKPPVRLCSIKVDASKAKEVKDPAVLIDDLTLVTRGTPQTPFFVNFERLGLGKELSSDEPFSARLRLQNLLTEKRTYKANVDVTTAKTAVMSHAETLKSHPFEVELGPGETKSWKFDYRYPAGIYNGYLTILDPAKNEAIYDQRIEYAVFPKAGGAGKDFSICDSGLSPFVLVRNEGPRLLLFQGMEPYGLGGPGHVAYVEKKRTRVAAAGQELNLDGMSECWMLFWFSGALGWDKLSKPVYHGATGTDSQAKPPYAIDVPMLVVFEKKPASAKPAGSGWEFSFAKECGHVGIVPLYGVSYVRASETARWEKSLPASVAARCRLFAEVSREYPISLEEKFKVDPVRDVVTVRDRFEFLSIEDEWGTAHRRVAPIEYMTALVNRSKWKPIEVQGKVLDLDMAVSPGAWAGIEGVSEYTYTLSGLLKYVNLIEQPKEIPPDDPLLADARKNFDVRDALWHRFHNSWFASENLRSAGQAGSLVAYLDEDARKYARASARAVADFTLNPSNLVFEYDRKKGVPYALDGQNYERMGWCDANCTSNQGLRAAFQYAVGTGDKELIRQRWPFLCSYYNVPLKMSSWGDSAFSAGGGDTFGDNLNGAISFARMAWWVGDDDSYKFGCYHSAKLFLSLYGVSVAYPRWVVEKDMWGTLMNYFEAREENGKVRLYGIDMQEVAAEGAPKDAKKEKVKNAVPVGVEDIMFTDLRGGNCGFTPWCQVQRTSDSQDRFLKDHARDYVRYVADGFARKWLPQWHKAVYVDQSKVPNWKELAEKGEKTVSWFFGSVYVMNVSIAPFGFDWDFFFDTPPAERRAKREKFIRSNSANARNPQGSIKGKEFEIILAGLERKYRPIWEGDSRSPSADAAFRTGLEKIASPAGCRTMAIAEPKFKWPTVGWHGLTPPQRPAVNSLGMLPLCGIVPDETKFSYAAASDSPNWGMTVWSAEHLRRSAVPAETVAELEKLPLHLQTVVVERGSDRVTDHVKTLLAQSELEWSVAGPFPYFQPSDFDKSFPPEEKVDLAADYGAQKIGREYAAKWRKAKAKMFLVDFNRLYEPNSNYGESHGKAWVDNAQVYAAIWVKCPEERDVKIGAGSDDGCKVWVNGTLAWKNWVHRGPKLDEDVFPVHLKKGWNAILVKVFNRMHGFGFELCLRFADDKMLPYGDLEFSSEPPKGE